MSFWGSCSVKRERHFHPETAILGFGFSERERFQAEHCVFALQGVVAVEKKYKNFMDLFGFLSRGWQGKLTVMQLITFFSPHTSFTLKSSWQTIAFYGFSHWTVFCSQNKLLTCCFLDEPTSLRMSFVICQPKKTETVFLLQDPKMRQLHATLQKHHVHQIFKMSQIVLAKP